MSMWCPACGAEYPSATARCPSCTVDLTAVKPDPPDELFRALGEQLADALNAYEAVGGTQHLSDVVQRGDWAEWFSPAASKTEISPTGGRWAVVLRRGTKQVVVTGRPGGGWYVAGSAQGPSLAPVAAFVEGDYKPLSTPAATLRVLFAMLVVVAGVTIAFRFQERSLLNDPAGATFAEVEASDDRLTTVWGIYLVLFLVTSPVFIFWFHRAYRNLEAFGRDDLRFSSGWAIGSWLIPFVNLVLPKIIANDLWRGSDPDAPIAPTGWKSRPVAGFVNVWWAAFVGGNLLGRYIDNAFENADTIDEAKTLNLLLIAASAIVLVGAVCAYLVVTRVTRRQHHLVDAQPRATRSHMLGTREGLEGRAR